MSWLPHRELRPVGLPWLGDVPSGWSLKKFRYCFRESAEKNGDTPVGEMLSVSGYRGVEVKRYEDENRRRTADELADYRVVRKGQLAVNTMWLNYAGLGVSAFEGHVSPAYRAYWINPGLEHRYINYLMRSSAYVDGYTALLTGIRPNSLQMGRNDLMNFPILCPPVDDQRVIADFLDRETPKIDELIAKQEQLIATLREDRTAIITYAVTKGLDPGVEMKDSGVEWLGRVPAHWLVRQLKWGCPVKRGASPRPIDDPKYFDNNGYWSWVRIADVSASGGHLYETTQRLSELGSSLSVRLNPGNLFVSIAGTVGKPCINHIPVCIHDGFVYFPNLDMETSYLFRIFEAGECYRGLGKLGTQLNLNTDTIGSIMMPFPSREEQIQIVSYLDGRCAKIDELIAKAEAVISTLQEYRSALITDAVTGKIDVREVA